MNVDSRQLVVDIFSCGLKRLFKEKPIGIVYSDTIYIKYELNSKTVLNTSMAE